MGAPNLPIFSHLEMQKIRYFIIYAKIMGGHVTGGPGAKLGGQCPHPAQA